MAKDYKTMSLKQLTEELNELKKIAAREDLDLDELDIWDYSDIPQSEGTFLSLGLKLACAGAMIVKNGIEEWDWSYTEGSPAENAIFGFLKKIFMGTGLTAVGLLSTFFLLPAGLGLAALGLPRAGLVSLKKALRYVYNKRNQKSRDQIVKIEEELDRRVKEQAKNKDGKE